MKRDQTNCYKLLEVDPAAQVEVIRQAYLFFSKKYHPSNPESGDPFKFRQVPEAWETLSNDRRRALHDRFLEKE